MKRRIKLIVSLALHAWDLLWSASLRLIGRLPAPKCVVLYYHAVSPAQREGFAQQMEQLARWTKPLCAESLPALERGHHYSVVTFDDGFVSVLENALPELERRSIPATVFVPTGCLGEKPSWIRNSSLPAFCEQVVSEARLAELSRHGLLTIGSHSVTHPRMSSLPAAEARREFRESKSKLEQILGRSVTLFSLPHGAYNEGVISEARAAGYLRVFGIEPALAFVSENEFFTGRVAVEPDDGPLEFRLKLLGAFRWLGRGAKVSV